MGFIQVKDGNNVSGTDRKTCPFYDELDAILGTRAASSPPVLLDSGGGSLSATASINDGRFLCALCTLYTLYKLLYIKIQKKLLGLKVPLWLRSHHPMWFIGMKALDHYPLPLLTEVMRLKVNNITVIIIITHEINYAITVIASTSTSKGSSTSSSSTTPLSRRETLTARKRGTLL